MTTQTSDGGSAERPDNRNDDMQQLLARILEQTRTMTEAARAGDFARITTLLQEREKALLQAAALAARGLEGAEAALASRVREEDGRFMATLKEQRASIARQLDSLRLERAIAAYRH